MLRSPVALIAYNRPELTKKTFEVVRRARPDRLFLIADGPKPGDLVDAERCAAVRSVLEQVDWRCEAEWILADTNMGLQRRVVTGLNRVFDSADRCIILEDDCLAGDEFFGFCDTLLERFEHEPEIMTITGDNFEKRPRRRPASYFFSRYPQCWGWATWSRSWMNFDPKMQYWPEWRCSAEWESFFESSIERTYWERNFDATYNGQIDTWAYPFAAHQWRAGGLTATPNVNLVKNLGFGPDATHTKGEDASPSIGNLGEIVHPTHIVRDSAADRHTFRHHYLGGWLAFLRRPLARSLRRIAGRHPIER